MDQKASRPNQNTKGVSIVMVHSKEHDWLDDDFKLGEPIVLSRKDFDIVLEAIKNPPKPNKFLRKLLERKRETKSKAISKN